ncbi:type II toxin-antitoxin system HicB family antitoxin [Helicobacter saguini]|uniref:Type II toxin-antitoxin system HicB family antitoxin n=1 Tax=Helicobacter saguini TaxID=1548018 RepID=A0A347VSJ2_9HELI|nr:type II toxin-antitoxin system HicB family antitoxin [Helicobacter saguini]MWV62484.1 type II toxin-antitoxin system HicB family antitoxin [Helicobacter saguini]MWV66843.1 type II toxin-antitoxin system HicB family antitoxin [Helicobacter saguini]MWV69193.1 type II toxin-antitoxin system HicB family antitoxin [Helicobacter saguini]MWV71252.1 type II toxin-antitoxin system HicB family antitoxin [Helicobacter saguini]TLD94229.1 type II toxin-antitoxin system HicB family antitoxin [Helicobacte
MILNAIVQKDSDGYFAYIPEFKGCVTQADSFEKAIENIKEAGELYLQSLEIEQVKALSNKITSIVQLEI